MATHKLSIIYLCIRRLVKKHLLSQQLDLSVKYNFVSSSVLQNMQGCQSGEVFRFIGLLMTVIYTYCVNCTKFGQLIFKKVIQTVATRCHILTLKMHQIRFRLGLRPRPCQGSLQRSPDPLAGFIRVPTSKGKGGQKKGKKGRGKRRGKRKKGRRRKGGKGGGEKGERQTPKDLVK